VVIVRFAFLKEEYVAVCVCVISLSFLKRSLLCFVCCCWRLFVVVVVVALIRPHYRFSIQ